MKKVFALLAVLLLMTGCAALAESGHAKEDYLGYWQLESVTVMGVQMSGDKLDGQGCVVFHEDDTVVVSVSADSFIGLTATYGSGGCTLDNKHGPLPVVIGEDGKLSLSVSADGLSMSLVCTRAAYPAMLAGTEDFVGAWLMESFLLNDKQYPASAVGEFTVTVYPSGFGIIEGDDTKVLFKLVMHEGRVQGLDGEGAYFPVFMDESGMLNVEITEDGLTLTIQCGPVAVAETVAEEAAAQETAAEAPADSAANPFLGQWNAVSVTMMGVEFPVEDAGLSGFTLLVEQDVAHITIGGETGSSPTVYEGDALNFYDGDLSLNCTIVDGRMHMAMTIQDVPMTVILTRTADTAAEPPAAEEATTEAPAANPFLGQWNAATVAMMGIEFPASEVGLNGMALRVEQDAAYLTMDGEEGACATSYEGDSMMFTNGIDRVVCTIVDGKLSMVIGDMTVIFERVGGAVAETVAETPAAEALAAVPAAEEATTEAPAANPFLGQWNAATVAMMGIEFPASEVGLNGMALRVEQDAAYLTMDGEEGACATSYEGDTLVFTNGSDRVVCTIVDGKLSMVIGDMTVIFERVGGAAAETVAETPAAEALAAVPAAEEVTTEAPAANPFLGQWNATTVAMMGIEFPASEVGLNGMALRVEQDAAYLTMDGEEGACATSYESDSLVFTNGSDRVVCTIADGKLSMVIGDMTVIFERVGGAAAQAPATTPALSATAAQPAAAAGFDGHWCAASVTALGMDFPASELAMDGYELVISGSQAQLIVDGQVSMELTAAGSDTLTLRSGDVTMTCALDETGSLLLNMTEGGLEYTLHMKREGASVANTAACDFCGKDYPQGMGYTVDGLVVCPDCYTRFFD